MFVLLSPLINNLYGDPAVKVPSGLPTADHVWVALLKLNKDEDPEGCQSKPFTPSVINGFEPLAPIPVI